MNYEEEIYKLQAAVENLATELRDSINRTSLQVADNTTNISTLTTNLQSLDSEVEDMDIEHHEELHSLAGNIDSHSTQINEMELLLDAIPSHEVMTEDEYEALGAPDPDKFYFTYEE